MAKGARERVYTARKVYLLGILSLNTFTLRCKTEIYFSKYILYSILFLYPFNNYRKHVKVEKKMNVNVIVNLKNCRIL